MAGEARLQRGQSLHLIVPIKETTWGDRESVIVDKVWFGTQQLSGLAQTAAIVAQQKVDDMRAEEGVYVGATSRNIALGGKTVNRIACIEGLARGADTMRVTMKLIEGFDVQRGYGGLKVEVDDSMGSAIIHFSNDSEVENFIQAYDAKFNETAGAVLRVTRALRLAVSPA